MTSPTFCTSDSESLHHSLGPIAERRVGSLPQHFQSSGGYKVAVSPDKNLGLYEIRSPLGAGGMHDAVFGRDKSSWCKILPTGNSTMKYWFIRGMSVNLLNGLAFTLYSESEREEIRPCRIVGIS